MTDISFDEIASKVLAICYESFPVPCDFYQNDFINTDKNSVNEVFYYTFKKLKDFGYITFPKPSMPCISFFSVELTEKGLSILNTPNSLKPKERLGQTLLKYIKAGAREMAFEVVRTIVHLGGLG